MIDFVNKGIDAIHLPKIFHSAEVVKLLPEKLRENDSIPVAAFKLQRPIRSKIFNYRQTVMDMDFQHDEEDGFQITYHAVTLHLSSLSLHAGTQETSESLKIEN